MRTFTGRLCPKGYLFQASSTSKGRDSHAEVYKRIGKYEIVKGPMAVKKSRKLRGLDSAFTRVSKVKPG